uniref:PiggyBac transposable element-derived protein domain-containing protein n=1 Tax=Octopus bimaculoides TaxID=37653 RepID=A0A0L8I8Q7_OCTBM
MVIKYYGHNSLKQFVKGKPIRFGYKFWALCGVSGYCYNFELFCGKNGKESQYDDLTLEAELFFKSLKFKIDEKGKRGSYDYRFNVTNEILIVKWLDNKCVSIGTNFDAIEPTSNVLHWKRHEKTRGNVSQPHILTTYNYCMGGVNKHDWLVSKYTVSIQGMTSSISKLINSMRYDSKGHAIAKQEKQGQCQHTDCQSKPLNYCQKCNVTLCVDSFSPYHSK